MDLFNLGEFFPETFTEFVDWYGSLNNEPVNIAEAAELFFYQTQYYH